MKLNAMMLAKGVALLGIGLWMAVAVVNNTFDMGTNLFFMKQMMTMSLIKHEPVLARGLMWRAISSPVIPVITMYLVVVIEAVAAILLLSSAVRLLKAALGCASDHAKVLKFATLSVTFFMCIWLWFALGDLWFGFWIKKGAFAAMHTLWIMISILLVVFINYQPSELVVLQQGEK